ncbi:hypothetical protein Tsubulata_014825 [Turnera subulata]|uniref:Uncharacterized protein n=1 Tax=Turnera subulata TaxID=218843 RepID=A0A9Q0FHI6_9ROSI|nr:hypothetical protein Tsubulata_014825 [Turnera subulata]
MTVFSLTTLTPAAASVKLHIPSTLFPPQLNLIIPRRHQNDPRTGTSNFITCCSNSDSSSPTTTGIGPGVIKEENRFRRQYPGEAQRITEEIAAMLFRRIKGKRYKKCSDKTTWLPSMEGFVKYLVDSQLVFRTIERIVDEYDDVSYAHFRKTGLERAGGLAKDLEWLSQQGILVPEASHPGVSYAQHLEQLAKESPPLFLCHFYNIYFAHIAGGQVISRQVSKKLLEGRELEFFRWEGDVQEQLECVREKLNMLGEHWTRDEKNNCLEETKMAFESLANIVRLIIL